MPDTDVRIVWEPRAPSTVRRILRTFTGAPTNPLTLAIEHYGMPKPSTPLSPIDEVKFFLRVAASVEHALMVEYLYAAYSIDDDLAKKLRPIFGQRLPLVRVAVQEMGHLLAVQNMLLLTGGEVCLTRQDHGPLTGTDNDPFPFTLEPFSKQSLAKYLLAESPTFNFESLPQDVKAFINHAREKLVDQPDLVPHPVGLIYARLYWFMQDDDKPDEWKDVADAFANDEHLKGRHITDADLAAASQTFQTTVDEWGDYTSGWDLTVDDAPLATRPAMRKLLHRIAEQGEGYTEGADSHFRAFAKVQAAVKDWTAPMAKQVPTNPSVRAANATVTITDPGSLACANAFNAVYLLLLTFIASALVQPRTGTEGSLRVYLLGQAVFASGMTMLRTLGKALMTMPLSNPADGNMAAPTFELEKSLPPIKQSEAKSAVLEAIDHTLSIVAQAMATPNLSEDQFANLDAVREQLTVTRTDVEAAQAASA